MLTGDENIIDINFVVLWKIGNAADFLFNVRDPENTVKAAAESVMREIIGQTPIVEATTEGRRAIEQRAREQLQALMNEYGTGILIDEVQLQKADPPAEVIDAFRDVQRAQADRERAQNEAEAFANDIIPRARGEAERLLQEAAGLPAGGHRPGHRRGAALQVVLAEYIKAEDVTARRLYLETMEQVLKGVNKVIIDGQQGANGVVPYLPLPDLERRAPAPRRGRAAGTCDGVRERRNERAPDRDRRCGAVAVALFLLSAARCSPSTRPSRRWCCSSATRSGSSGSPASPSRCPFIQQVEYFEKRVLDFDAPSVELVLGDQKRLVVDAFARYRIADPLRFRQSRRQRDWPSAAGSSRSSSRACAACWARRPCSRSCQQERARPDEPHPGRGQPGAGPVRRRGGRRAHQARRPAGREQPGDLPADADRARARGARSCGRKAPRSVSASGPVPTASAAC